MKNPAKKRTVNRDEGGVAEFQGLYGTFEFPERLLQKIWHLGFFTRSGLKTSDGREIEVIAPGEWNRLAGPDFRNATLRIGGVVVNGDIEVHFHAKDWLGHGHSRNPDYDGVVLHVVLFAPDSSGVEVRTSKGSRIPLLVLLPYLACSIEEFALEDALEGITHARAAGGLAEFFRGRAVEAVLSELAGLARKRWHQKVEYSRTRIAKLGWEGACHHTALEILGYRHNRAPMLGVAERFPLEVWTLDTMFLERVMEVPGSRWRTSGSRPANHPRRRLAQYQEWTRSVPRWPGRLTIVAQTLPVLENANPLAATAEVRRAERVSNWRTRFAGEVAGGAISGTRLDTMVTNGFLPLLAADSSRDYFQVWCSWFAGDSPDWLKGALREGRVGTHGHGPLCEGLVQGLLQLTLEQTAIGK